MIELKSISEILDKDFFIPSYQRGYRWDTQQVEELLEDILEFVNKDKVKKEFYCLQPVVVKKNTNGDYRVIDGQQRLTTIFILLQYFKRLLEDDYFIENVYSISYETRSNSQNFLDKIEKVDEINKMNIDFFYMSKTYITIKAWFKENIINKRITKNKFLEALIVSEIKEEVIDGEKIKIDYANNLRIIWYEIQDKKEIDVFTRLNSGQIPLTPAELIKALFLLDKKGKENEQLLLASQWDEIEYKLQDENFFAFINGEVYDKPTRIEFIFDLIANNKEKKVKIEHLRKDDKLRSFYIFNELIKNPKQDLWDEVKTYFRVFDELYNNNDYYHLVGFLINSGKKIQDIVNKFHHHSKDSFLKEIEARIEKKVSFENKKFEELNYHEDYKEISNLLFLFNVLVTLESRYARYPFDKHKSELWSLEHIHAQNSQDIDVDDKKILLESQLSYINDEDIKEEINQLRKSNKLDEALAETSKFFGDESSLHTIDNLTLLSKDDNSSLSNSVFPIKRDKIKQLDKNGSFIPLGTKNVFLKYYSNDVKEAVKWSKEDKTSYLKVLKETLKPYIEEEK